MITIFKNKTIPALLVASLMTVFLLSGCSSNATTTAKSEPPKAENINITYVKSPLNVPSIIEKHEELFQKEFSKDNITVAFHEITSGAKQTEALAAGGLDILNCVGGTSVILAASNGVDLKVISIYGRGPKAYTILTKSSDIKTVADLKGKKIGGPKGTVLHELLLTALGKNNLTQNDVEFISMDISAANAALMSGSIDAALLAGPDALRAIDSGAKTLTTGEGLVEGTIVVAVRGEFLRNHPDLVKRFNKVHQESLKFMKENQEKMYEIAAQETGLSLDQVKMMYDWYDFDSTIRPSDIEALKKTQEFLENNNMLTNTIKIEDLIAEVK